MSVSILLGGTGFAAAQVVPDRSTPPAATPIGVPGAYTNTAVNYIRTWEPNVPTTSPTTVINATTVRAVKQTVQYFDGLGRPLQTVTKGISPNGKDLIEPVIYDNFGREQFKYLPYVQQSGKTDDGRLKKDPFASQRAFYWNASLNPGVKGDSVFYTRVVYENSPLNRVSKTYAPGNSWAMHNPSTIERGGNRPVENRYQVNTVDDSVRIWNLSTGMIPTSSGAYAPGNLVKNVTRDEDGKYIIEYKDKEDKVILKKVQLSGPPGMAHVGWLCTYYVYDDLSNLRMVIPPQAVMEVRHNWTLTAAVAGGLCFIYRYDGRNRMIVKKLPGADSTEIVYDKRDRLVFSRDGNLKKVNKWLVTFYDNLNRPNRTAFYYAADTRSVLQQRMDGITAENPIPDVPATSLGNLSLTYYDNYSFSGKYSPETGDLSKPQAGSNPYAEKPTAVSTLTRGLVTGTATKILGVNQWLKTTIYYDDNGRVIQTIADNVAGGKDITTNLYDFSGKLLSTYLRHTNPHSATTPNITVLTQQSYDTAGRPRVIRKRLNDNTTQEKITVANYYDELGRLKTKRLGVTATSQLEVLNYEYNIRGWLRAINKEYLSSSTASHFGQTIYYDWGFSTNQFNGNIAGIRWKGWNDKTSRAYGYTYDIANRLTGAAFTQQNAGGSWTRDKFDFSVSKLAYDGNGNILSMAQKGMVGPVIQTIDSLKYGYQAQTNKLSFVTDKRNNPQSQLGDFKEITSNETQDYWFDASGNLAKDKNKNIDTILFNHLNLPDSIVIRSKGAIRYHYDAAGNKLRKMVIDKTATPAKIDTTDYISGMVYKNDTLQFISHEEGRIRPVFKASQPIRYVYDYFVKDHLGNVRLVLTEQSDFSMYTATMETENAPKENALFSNIDQTRTSKPVGYPQDNTTLQNAFVAKLNAQEGGKKIGPSLVLRVMAGDTVQIGAKAFYKSQGPKDSKQTVPVEDMVANLVQAFGGATAADATHTNPQTEQLTPFTNNFYSNDYQRLRERDPNQNRQDKPRSYLNFVLFDDQFNLVEENSGVRQVKGEPDELQTLGVDKMPIEKSGFLYVYTSNESPQDVFFDNVTLGVASGPVLEETHYYPFGGTLAGISVNALKGTKYPENRYRYNGIEKIGDLGLEDYDAKLRELDPQIGRWWQIDPKTDNMEMWSPYASNYNNPVRFSDFLGDEPGDPPGFVQGVREGFTGFFSDIADAVTNPGEALKNMASPQNLISGTLNGVTLGAYGTASQVVDNVRVVMNEGAYGAGKIVGRTAAEAAVVVATEGAGKAVSTIRGAGQVTNEAAAVTESAGRGMANPKVASAVGAGKKAHAEFSSKAAAKGWQVEPRLTDPTTGKTVKPDAVTPTGRPVELKPNTTSGRAQGAKQLPKYERATGNKGRVIYYDPEKYRKQ